MSASQGYQLIQRLGNGAAGAVYLAESERGRVAIRQFASKAEINSQAWQSERQRFLEAGRRSLGLKHPRIVPVLEVIDEAGEAFVAMEYVAAETLAAAMAARRLRPEETDVVLRQVAMALDFAHGRGVIHGDLKPSDIFLTPKGARVSDFAISPRAWQPEHQALPASLLHGYLSPEHLRDPASVGARSDQYSLAVIAYQMYTGQSPYGESARDPRSAILYAPVVPPSQVEPGLPKSIDAPLLKALDRDPNGRYNSCMEAVAFLGAGFITHAGVAGEKRSSTGIYAVVGALLLLLLLALWWWWPKHKTPGNADKKNIPTQGGPASAANRNPGGETAKTAAGKGIGSSKGTSRTRNHSTEEHDLPKGPGSQPTTGATRSDGRGSVVRGGPDDGGEVQPARGFTIDVLSRRTHKIDNDSSFPVGDTVLGEMAQGDLTANISFEGQQMPRGALVLEWSLDGVVVDRVNASLNRFIEYGNEPTAGKYRVTVKLNGRPVQSLAFTITP